MIQQPRLPYVRFVSDVKETRNAEGHIERKMVYMAHITPAGGKDEVVKDAEEWLADLRRKGDTRGPFDSNANEYGRWYEHFSKVFAQYKAGEEMTHPGTPLRGCLSFMKTEIAACEAVHIFTLEGLADANEEALRNIGVGARALKEKAADLLKSQKDNRLAEENAALRAQNEALQEQVRQFMSLSTAQTGRRRNTQTEPEAA